MDITKLGIGLICKSEVPICIRGVTSVIECRGQFLAEVTRPCSKIVGYPPKTPLKILRFIFKILTLRF